ncbi:MAG: hypothetical protein JNL24_03830 [Bacteroidia bacterium]|nr:hypothetical protein [Bacteroidia bacterium]
MNFAFTVIGLVLGGLGTLICLVFTIIALSGGKTKNAASWGIGFAVSISLLIFSIVSLVNSISDKVKNGVEWLEQHENKSFDDMNVDYQAQDRANMIDTLKAYTNEMYADKVPADFYSSAKVEIDSNGIMVVPFLYPYSLRINTYTSLADIVVDAKDSVFVQNVSQFSFDQNFVIARIDNAQSKDLLKKGHAEIEYLLFDMRTGNYENANNMEMLMDFANRIGFVGPKDLRYISEDYTGWFDYEQYD